MSSKPWIVRVDNGPLEPQATVTKHDTYVDACFAVNAAKARRLDGAPIEEIKVYRNAAFVTPELVETYDDKNGWT